jgi:predicted TIM-barrel fold metal-dependent hydrolase
VWIDTRKRFDMNKIMWSSDYPHTDSTWPRSLESIEHDFAGVSESDRIQMTYTNAAKLYGFDVGGKTETARDSAALHLVT